MIAYNELKRICKEEVLASVGEQGPGYAAYTEVFRSEVLLCDLCIKIV